MAWPGSICPRRPWASRRSPDRRQGRRRHLQGHERFQGHDPRDDRRCTWPTRRSRSPIIDDEKRVDEDKAGDKGEVSELDPGKSGSLTVNLKPGIYLLYLQRARSLCGRHVDDVHGHQVERVRSAGRHNETALRIVGDCWIGSRVTIV